MATFGSIPDDALETGEVFTRRWVVDLILDLAGYDAARDLGAMVAIEPACGTGAFLGPMVERLSASCRERGRSLAEAGGAIRAFDLLARNVETSRRLVEKVLIDADWDAVEAAEAAAIWVTQGDYLLSEQTPNAANFVIGNPPYIRLEEIPADRMAAYRATCRTMIGRADIYIGFFEVGLRSLGPDGTLAFICADRWMRNQYGREIRRLIASQFNLRASILMHDVDAFEEKVSAYPAITVVQRAPQGTALVAETTKDFGSAQASQLVRWSQKRSAAPIRKPSFEAARLPHWFDSNDSWPSGSPGRLALIEELNDRFSSLEDTTTGTRVGIGVATGADSVFITREAAVEADRLLPLSMVRDTTAGTLSWSGHHLVNPWTHEGGLVDLQDYPLLRKYFEQNARLLKGRHVAKKAPGRWYRTIDKVDHSLVGRAKLLFPDMKMTIHPVLDEGGRYPHHNLYYVVSDLWDLEVLGGLLLSRVAEAFVEAYAVKMRGGTLRFQAQYLRRIRVPHPSTISADHKTALAAAFRGRDADAATAVAIDVYGIDDLAGALLNGSSTVRKGRT